MVCTVQARPPCSLACGAQARHAPEPSRCEAGVRDMLHRLAHSALSLGFVIDGALGQAAQVSFLHDEASGAATARVKRCALARAASISSVCQSEGRCRSNFSRRTAAVSR